MLKELEDLIEQLATGISLEDDFDVYETLHCWEVLRDKCGWDRAFASLAETLATSEYDMRKNGNLEELPLGAWCSGLMGHFDEMMQETMKQS